MSLNPGLTASDIKAALQGQGLNVTNSIIPYWTAIANAIYERVKADIEITSETPPGVHVSVTGNATAQQGFTDAIGVAQNTLVE